MKSTKWLKFLPLLLLVFLFALPSFMHSISYLSRLNQLYFNIILAMGVFAVWTVGYINAAQPVFLGLGSYTLAILMMHFHMPWLVAFVIAGIIPAIIALLFGFVGLKLKGAYFLFLTIALDELIEWLFKSWKGLFNGTLGLFPVPQPTINIFGLHITFAGSQSHYYYLSLLLAVVTCLFYFKIYGSRLGRVWETVAKNEDLLANTGVSVFTQKQIALVTSCFFAGLGGALYASYTTIVTPGQFTLWQGIWIVLGCLLGGIFSPIGAIIGTVFMSIMYVILQGYSSTQPLILGIILILVILFMPSGFFGLFGKVRNKIKDMTGKKVAQTEIK